MAELSGVKADFVQLVRLALDERTEDVHLFAARLARRYRATEPELAEQLVLLLRAHQRHAGGLLRKH